MLNKVMLIGNLGADPETRSSASGVSICRIRLATSSRRKEGESWVDHTEWHKVVCFGRTAENVQKYCQKGKQLYIEGELRTTKWQDKEGRDQWTTEIVANDVKFLGGGSRSDSGGHTGGQAGGGYSPGSHGGGPADEEIPF
jgi:single-strand DNA-binding protein